MSARSRSGREAGPNRPHVQKLLFIWSVFTLILTPIVYFVWGPKMPPGSMSVVSRSQQFDNRVAGRGGVDGGLHEMLRGSTI